MLWRLGNAVYALVAYCEITRRDASPYGLKALSSNQDLQNMVQKCMGGVSFKLCIYINKAKAHSLLIVVRKMSSTGRGEMKSDHSSTKCVLL